MLRSLSFPPFSVCASSFLENKTLSRMFVSIAYQVLYCSKVMLRKETVYLRLICFRLGCTDCRHCTATYKAKNVCFTATTVILIFIVHAAVVAWVLHEKPAVHLLLL